MIALEAHGTCVPVSLFQSRVYLLHPSPSSGCTPQGSNGGLLNSHKKTSNVYIVQDRNVCIEDMRLCFSFFNLTGNAGDDSLPFFMKTIKKRDGVFKKKKKTKKYK